MLTLAPSVVMPELIAIERPAWSVRFPAGVPSPEPVNVSGESVSRVMSLLACSSSEMPLLVIAWIWLGLKMKSTPGESLKLRLPLRVSVGKPLLIRMFFGSSSRLPAWPE